MVSVAPMTATLTATTAATSDLIQPLIAACSCTPSPTRTSATPEKPYVPGGGVARARKSGLVRRGAGLGLLPPGGAAGGFCRRQVHGGGRCRLGAGCPFLKPASSLASESAEKPGARVLTLTGRALSLRARRSAFLSDRDPSGQPAAAASLAGGGGLGCGGTAGGPGRGVRAGLGAGGSPPSIDYAVLVFHSCWLARRAPSVIAASFAQVIFGSTGTTAAKVAKPQSLPAMTFFRPTTSA